MSSSRKLKAAWPVLGAWLLIAATAAGYAAAACILAWYLGAPWWVGLVPVVLMLALAEVLGWMGSDHPVRADLSDAGEAEEPRLHAVVDRLSALSGQDKPILRIMETQAPNSLVFTAPGERPTLCVSRGLLELLDNSRLESVLAHEFAHLAHRDAQVMAFADAVVGWPVRLPAAFVGAVERIDPVLCAAARKCGRAWKPAFQRTSADGPGLAPPMRRIPLPLAAPLLVLLGVVRALLITLACVAFLGVAIPAGVACLPGFAMLYRLNRRRELAADRGAAELTGAPAGLAAALAEIEGGMLAVPEEDLRELSNGSPLAILPFQRPGTADGPLQRLFDWTYRTHPRTTARVARLEGLSRDMATRPPD